MIPAIIIVSVLVLYVIGIFVYDGRRKKKGMPSLFLDECDSEGRGKRLVREFHKMKSKKGK